MLYKQIFIVTEAHTTQKREDLWYQTFAALLQNMFGIQPFLIDLTEAMTPEIYKAQQQEFELITRSLRDPFLIISHGIGSRFVLTSQLLTKSPHIMVAPYLYRSSNHEYEERATITNAPAFSWEILEKFLDTFIIELSEDTLIDKISHKEAGSLRTLHFHHVPYDGHAETTGSHNKDIPDLFAEIFRIMISRGYITENELFIEYKRKVSQSPLHITPHTEIQTLNGDLALATDESSPAKISQLLREAREKETFFNDMQSYKKNVFEKKIAIGLLVFGILALIVLLINDTVSITAPRTIVTTTSVSKKASTISEIQNITSLTYLSPSFLPQEGLDRKNYLYNLGFKEENLSAASYQDIYAIKNVKMPEAVFFTIQTLSNYITSESSLVADFLRLAKNEKLTSKFDNVSQVTTYSDITGSERAYTICKSETICGISTNKDVFDLITHDL